MLSELFHTLSIWIVILPAIAGFINYSGLNSDSKWIFYLVLAAIIPQILTSIINKETFLLNISYNIYTPLEFSILYQVFRTKYDSKPNKVAIFISMIFYVISSLIFIFYFGITKSFLNSWVCVNNLIYIIWILLFLKEQYHSDTFLIYRKNPFAWYILALIIYAPGTSMTFALYHYIREDNSIWLKNLKLIQDFCNILLYLLFTAGLFVSRKKIIPKKASV